MTMYAFKGHLLLLMCTSLVRFYERKESGQISDEVLIS